MAVHPEDERYKGFHGKKLVHPFSDREVPIILDPVLVDMAFGTGAVKVRIRCKEKKRRFTIEGDAYTFLATHVLAQISLCALGLCLTTNKVVNEARRPRT